MDIKEKLKSLRSELLKFVEGGVGADSSGGYTYKLKDGTVIYTSNELGTGTVAYAQDADGAKLLLPSGSYDVEGYGTIVVGEGGVIQEVVMNEAEKMNKFEVSPEEMQQIVNAVFDMVMAKLKEGETEEEGELSKKVDGLYEKSAELNQKFESVVKIVGEMTDTIEKFGEQPSPKKSSYQLQKEAMASESEQRAQQLAQIIQKIKTQN